MSNIPIDRSPDLRRLRDEGYDIAVRSGYLVVRGVPYVTTAREVQLGVLVSALNLAGDVTTIPKTHVMYFAGEYPCHQDGQKIGEIQHSSHPGKRLAEGVSVDHQFSAKPSSGKYPDYYEKVTTYVQILGGPAHAIDPTATARTYPVIADEGGESVFHYTDTASSRVDIVTVAQKLGGGSVAIVGLGGTGSYILDFVAKTPVLEIHLIDGDVFRQHNAFRAPGAPAIETLAEKPLKVDYLRGIYGRMHKNIIAHPCFLNESNLSLLDAVEFVFFCFDDGPTKRAAMDALIAAGKSFVDVGMGLEVVNDSISGLLRVTAASPERNDHVLSGQRVSFGPVDADDEYATNIQVADLNALNAALAVIKWKKLFGFYLDLEQEHHITYALNGNEITNEELRE